MVVAITNDSRFRPYVIGIPWCREEDYDAFVAIFVDAKDLPRTWQEFAEAAEESEKFHKEQGYVVKRIYIDLHTFPDCCRAQGYRVNANARARFADRTANAGNNRT
jgi:hypothetical protein